jgi:deoxyribose-phosphate aldolase
LQTVKLMRDSVPASIGVKVAGTGSFWTGSVVLGCFLAGADLIGTRNGLAILDELPLLELLYDPANLS